MIEILSYSPMLLPELTALVNQHIEAVPPYWTLTPSQVETIVNNGGLLWDNHYPEEAPSYQTITLAALEDGRLVAAAQCFYPEDDYRVASLMWVMGMAGHDAALDELLRAVETQTKQRGFEVVVSSRCAFGIGWIGIPTQWDHIIRAFDRAGYNFSEKWLIMCGETGATAPPVPGHLAQDWRVHVHASEWELYLYDGTNVVGECGAWGVPMWFEDCADFKAWTTVEWLEVGQAYRGQGIGKALLGEQLRYQAGRGIKNVMVWCPADNTAVQRVNKSLGFRVACETWSPQLVLSSW